MKVYLLEAMHWHTPGCIKQVFKELTGPGGAQEEAQVLVNKLRKYVDLSPAEGPEMWEEHLLEARKKRALDLNGDDDVDDLEEEDDAYVEITELNLIEPGEKAFLYAPTLRPASFSTLPDGITWDYVEAPSMAGLANRPELPVSSHRYGVIKTNRRLFVDECMVYDLKRL